MGLVLKIFGIFITAIVLTATLHLFRWLPLGDVMDLVAELYRISLEQGVFFAAQSVPWGWFELTPPEMQVTTLMAVLIFGPISIGLLTIDHEFRDSGAGGLLIARVMAFLFTLTLFAMIGGVLPTVLTFMGFGGIIIGFLLYCVVRGFFLRKRRRVDEDETDEDEPASDEFEAEQGLDFLDTRDNDDIDSGDEEPARRKRKKPKYEHVRDIPAAKCRFVIYQLLYIIAAGGLLIWLDDFASMEEDCFTVNERCLLQIRINEAQEEAAPAPSDPAPMPSELEEVPPQDPLR